MISGSVLISDAVFLELVNALNQYSDEEEEGHNDSEAKQEDGKEELPVTRKRKRIAVEGGFGCRNWLCVGHVSILLSLFCYLCVTKSSHLLGKFWQGS